MQANVDPLQKHSLWYHAYSIWLFTFSDLKTIVGPNTAFGVVTALSGPVLTNDPSPNSLTIIGRLPHVLFWVWVNLLPFTIDNQRQAEAILEDKVNKPWRPMPSGRLTSSQAKTLMLLCYTLALLSSFPLGGVKQSILLIFFGWAYNDVGGADRSCIVRNLINSLGYLCFTSGAVEVVAPDLHFSGVGYSWFLIIAAVVLSTVQLQDTFDQVGDHQRGRWTVSLVLGDSLARWTIAIPMIFWSSFCPIFLRMERWISCIPLFLGTVISLRVLLVRTCKGDKNTFKLWNLWMLMIYCLPLTKRFQG